MLIIKVNSTVVEDVNLYSYYTDSLIEFHIKLPIDIFIFIVVLVRKN